MSVLTRYTYGKLVYQVSKGAILHEYIPRSTG